MLGGGYGVELGRKCLEVCILSKFALSLSELTLSLGLEMNFGWTQRILLGNKVILVNGF